jgi:hypothetical protein
VENARRGVTLEGSVQDWSGWRFTRKRTKTRLPDFRSSYVGSLTRMIGMTTPSLRDDRDARALRPASSA